MSPVFTQEFVPDTQSQLSSLATSQSTQGVAEAGRIVRASFTALGLALSLGATGSLISSVEAADSMQLAALPSVTGAPGTLPSFGSTRPEGAAATYHTVADGETIWDIAKRHGVTVEDIKSVNGIGEAQVIQAGQVLKVPTAASAPDTSRSPSVVLSIPQESVPQKVAANASAFTVESQPRAIDDLQEDRLEADSTSAEPLRLSEFIDQHQQAVRDQREENSVSTATASTATAKKPLAAATEQSSVTIRNEEMVAALPETEPVEIFAEQVQLPEKTSAKSAPLQVQAENVLEVFREEQITHRVGSGESIWSIARSYGTDPEVLQSANDVTDPSFIVAGDELVIPEGAALEVEADPDTERLAHRQIRAERRMASLTPVIEKVDTVPSSDAVDLYDEEIEEEVPSTLAIGLEPQSFEIQGADTAIADPFVEGMLSQVAYATQSQVSVAAATAERYSSEAASQAIAANPSTQVAQRLSSTLEESTEVAINPQFAGLDEAEAIDAVSPSLGAEELLAAAPLGSEVYAPVIESPEGRVVSPDMPVLPGQEEYLPEAPNRFEGYIWPAQGVLTSGYGWRWGRMHRGVDIAGPVGTPIYAAGPGVVVKSGWNSGGYGNLVDIRHPDGSMTRYAHNSRLLVNEGQQVRQGQQIAEMGSTGYSTGPHLHFEIHIPNQGTVNPIALLPGR